MSRTLTGPTTSAVAGPVTRPAYLVQINWSAIARLTTGTTLSWNGSMWVSAAAQLSGLSWRAGSLQSATLTLNNMAQEYSSLALSEGVADVPVYVWAYDQAATAAGDPVRVFTGVGNGCSMNDNFVVFELTAAGALKSPRLRVTSANGFNHLPAAGEVIRWGSQRYVMSRRK